jgi:hypothetical protein
MENLIRELDPRWASLMERFRERNDRALAEIRDDNLPLALYQKLVLCCEENFDKILRDILTFGRQNA